MKKPKVGDVRVFMVDEMSDSFRYEWDVVGTDGVTRVGVYQVTYEEIGSSSFSKHYYYVKAEIAPEANSVLVLRCIDISGMYSIWEEVADEEA